MFVVLENNQEKSLLLIGGFNDRDRISDGLSERVGT
jgi:hypothetical protein